MRLVFIFDFDGVIADSFSLRSVAAKKLLGLDIPAVFIQQTKYHEAGLTAEQYQAVKEAVYANDYEPLDIEGAIDGLMKLLSAGDDVSVVTARKGKDLEKAKVYMAKKNCSIPMVGVGYRESKVEACKMAHVFVEDDIQNLIPLIGIVEHLFFFVGPQNEHEVVPPGITPVCSWVELMFYLEQIQNIASWVESVDL